MWPAAKPTKVKLVVKNHHDFSKTVHFSKKIAFFSCFFAVWACNPVLGVHIKPHAENRGRFRGVVSLATEQRNATCGRPHSGPSQR